MTRHNLAQSEGEDDLFVIGQGIGPIGRWLRLFLGLYFLIFLVLNPLYLHPIPASALPGFALAVGGYLILVTAAYFIVFWLIRKPILSTLNPWAGTAIFLGIPTILALLGIFPPPLQMAFGFYVGCSLILIFIMRYGGCEVVALPSLVLKRRFTVYCPYNAIDAVERAMTPEEGSGGQRLLTIVSLAIVIFIGGYFIVVASNNLLGRYGIAVHIDNRWSLLLLVPCAQLGALALKHYGGAHSLLAPKVRKYALGAIILLLTIIAFLFQGAGVTGDALWVGAMALGALFALFQIAMRLIRRFGARRQPT